MIIMQPLSQPHPIYAVVAAVHRADQFKVEQLATNWPELADALANLIEGTTELDAPRVWHTSHEEGTSA